MFFFLPAERQREESQSPRRHRQRCADRHLDGVPQSLRQHRGAGAVRRHRGKHRLHQLHVQSGHSGAGQPRAQGESAERELRVGCGIFSRPFSILSNCDIFFHKYRQLCTYSDPPRSKYSVTCNYEPSLVGNFLQKKPGQTRKTRLITPASAPVCRCPAVEPPQKPNCVPPPSSSSSRTHSSSLTSRRRSQ